MLPFFPGRRRLLVQLAGAGLATTLPALAAPPDDAAGADVISALRSGRVAILLRHARTTSGAGDPPGFELGDCSTQRNLDAEGRAHAQRIGRWFATYGIVPEVVRNSPWCRARDTARLAFGRTGDWPALANVYGREVDPRHVEEVRSYVAGLSASERAVLVSHGSSIQAIVGQYLAQGEAVVVRARGGDRAESSAGGTQGRNESSSRLEIVGRIAVP
jgi:phosphohistidine phosphatase SixA